MIFIASSIIYNTRSYDTSNTADHNDNATATDDDTTTATSSSSKTSLPREPTQTSPSTHAKSISCRVSGHNHLNHHLNKRPGAGLISTLM